MDRLRTGKILFAACLTLFLVFVALVITNPVETNPLLLIGIYFSVIALWYLLFTTSPRLVPDKHPWLKTLNHSNWLKLARFLFDILFLAWMINQFRMLQAASPGSGVMVIFSLLIFLAALFSFIRYLRGIRNRDQLPD